MKKRQGSKHKAISVFSVVLIASCLSGCVFVPVIAGFKDSGVTASQRVAKLPDAVKQFQDAVFWGEPTVALKMVEPSSVGRVQNILSRMPEDRRVVESKLLAAEYDAEAYEAEVTVATKAYRTNTLVVTTDKTKQRWLFQMGEGWKLTDLDVVPVEEGQG